MAVTQYDQHVINSLPVQTTNKDKRVVLNGSFVKKSQLRYNLSISYRFVTRPFISNNPYHSPDFPESLAWCGGNPDSPDNFGAESGEDQKINAFTKSTMGWLLPVSLFPPVHDHPS